MGNDSLFVEPSSYRRSPVVNEIRARRQTSVGATLFAPIGAVAGGLDTIGQSLGVVDDNDFERFFGSLNQNAGSLYRDNKAGYRFVGDIGSLFVGAGAASKLLRAGSYLSRGLQSLGSTGRAVDRVVSINQSRVDELVGRYAKYSETAGAGGARGTTGFAEARSLRSQIRRSTAANDLRSGVATEAFMFGAMSESELFFPEGQSTRDVLFMSTVGLGIGGALGQLFVTPAIKRAGGASARRALRRGDVYSDDASLDLLTAAKEIADARLGVDTDLLDQVPELQGVANNREATARIAARKSVQHLSEQSTLGGLSGNLPVTEDVIDSVLDIASTNDKMVANIVSLEKPEVMAQLGSRRASEITKLEAERLELANELLEGATDVRTNIINQTIDKVDEQLRNLNGGTYVVRVNSIGQMSSNPLQESIFDGSKVIVRAIDDKAQGSTRRVFFPEQGTKDRTYGFSVDGRLMRGKRETSTMSGANVRDRTKPYAAMSKALRHLGKILGDDKTLVKAPNRIVATSSHLTLDYVIEAQKRYGGSEDDFSVLSKVFDLSAFSSLKELHMASLNSKFLAYKELVREQNAALKIGKDLYNAESIGQILNLKFSDDFGSANYGLQWFEDLRRAGAKSIGKDLDEALEDFSQHFSLGSTKGTAAKLLAERGKGASRLLDTDLFARLDKPQAPFAMVVQKQGRVDNSMFDVKPLIDVKTEFERVRDLQLSSAVKTTIGAEMFAKIDETMVQSPELLKSMQDGSRVLSNDTVDQPIVGALGQLTPFSLNYLLRGVQGADSAGIIADIWQRTSKVFAAEELKTNAKALNVLRGKGNERSAAMYLHYHSAMQQGWNLVDGVPDSLGRLALEQGSDKNNIIAKQMGLKDTPEFLPHPVTRNGTALKMDELSVKALAEIRRFSDMRYSMDGVLSNHMGRAGTQYRQGHTIEPSRHGKEMAFVTDEHGTVVDVTYGSTTRSARKAASQRRDEIVRLARNEGKQASFGLVTRDDVAHYKQAYHQAWNSANIDVSDAWSLTSGKLDRGGRSGLYTDTNFIDDQLQEVAEMFEDSARKFVATKFSGQIENVRAMQSISNVEKRGLTNFVTGESGTAFEDVYDKFNNQLLNTSTRNRGSLYGSLGMTAEHVFDSTLGKMYDMLSDIPTSRNPAKASAVMQAMSKELTEQHGFNPAETAITLAERSMGAKMPPDMLKVMRGAASFTQAMALKFFEVGHAALTTASIATTIPHNVEWMRRGANESVEAFKERVGVAGDFLDDNYAVPNASRLAMTTVAKHVSGGYKDVVERAGELGYLNSQIAEFVNDLTSPAKTAFGRGLRTFGDYAGMVSGKSEDYARTISFLTGYEMFSKQGRIGDKMAMAMANDFANKVIADYRPHQRAEVFKGATGVPLAMFQTFAINYFQRLLMNVENKQWKALGIQYGTQAFVFGGSSVPGYELMNEAVLETWNEKQRPEDLVREGFGKGLSDLFLYGTLGNLPKLLGADDGLAFHTRGEMSVPQNVSLVNMFNSPVAQLASRSLGGMRDAFKAAAGSSDTGGLNRMQEALIYAIPNRPTKGLFEYIQGHSTNAQGQIINNEISGLYDFAQRISGLKTLRDADQAAALWRDRETELSQRDSMTRLSASVEAGMRGGNFDSDNVQGTIESYFSNGGSPRGFRRWYRERLTRSRYSQGDRALIRAVRQGDRGQDILRFAE